MVEILDEEFPGGETTQGLIVYQRDGGLTEADRQKIADDAEAVDALPDEELPLVRPPVTPFPETTGSRPSRQPMLPPPCQPTAASRSQR